MGRVQRRAIIADFNRYSMVRVPTVSESIIEGANPLDVHITTRYDKFDNPQQACAYSLWLDWCRVGENLSESMKRYKDAE